MLRFKTATILIWLRNTAVATVVLGGGTWVVQWAAALSKQDPFAALRPRQIPGVREEVGVVLEDVEFTVFDKDKKLVQAEVDKFEVVRDRVTYDLTGIRNGTVFAEPPKTATRFASATGTWRNDTRTLQLGQDSRVAGKDFDFKTSAITIQEETKLITLPKPISGRLKDGIARAESAVINFDTERVKANGVRYIGRLPGVFQDGAVLAQNPRTAWDIRSETVEDSGAETRVMTQQDATATDGEVLLKAPKIQLDRKTDVLTATGRVFYYSAKANMVADKVVVYRKEKRAVFEGNVVMLVKPKDEQVDYKPTEEELPPFRPLVPDEVKAARPSDAFGPSEEEKELDKKLRDGNTLRQFPLTLFAKNIDYVYKKGQRKAKITGDPQGKQSLPGERWRNVWCYEADYDGEEEILKTFSRADAFDCRMKNSIGDDLTAKSFLIHTKEGDERYTAQKIKGRVFTDPDDDPRDKDKKSGTTGTTGTSGGGGG